MAASSGQSAQTVYAARPTRTLYRRARPTLGALVSVIFVVVTGFLMFAPLVWMVLSGLKTEREVTLVPPQIFPEVWQWGNFDYVIRTSPIAVGYLNSMIVVPIILFIQLVTSIVGGYV